MSRYNEPMTIEDTPYYTRSYSLHATTSTLFRDGRYERLSAQTHVIDLSVSIRPVPVPISSPPATPIPHFPFPFLPSPLVLLPLPPAKSAPNNADSPSRRTSLLPTKFAPFGRA